MLTTTRKQLIEQIIEREGMLFRVVFAVSNEFGTVKGEILKVIPLGRIDENQEILALPEANKVHAYTETLEKVFFKSQVSPFSDLIFINGSKPRAPTIA